MTRIHRRRAIVVLAVLAIASGIIAFTTDTTRPAPAPTGQAGSVVTADLTVMPPPAAAPTLPVTSEPAPEFTAAELRYLQLLHDKNQFEHEYASDASMVLIGHGLCAGRDGGETVLEQIDYLDQRGYTSLAAGWIVGSALQELCGDR